MTIPVKTLKNGFSMPVFGLGTWRMGGDVRHSLLNDDKADIAAIRYAIEHGITHIDTAELYAAGHTEKLVAQAIQGFDRTKLFLVSKVLSRHLAYDDVIRSCEGSLHRLKTDYLDLYLIHAPNPSIDIRETMRALDTLKRSGKIRAIGVSNFTAARMEAAQKVTENKLVATQVHYNLLYREPEHAGVLDYCQKNDMLLIAWRPVEKGTLTASGTPCVDRLCEKYHCTPAQIAINWLISQKNVVTLSKMRSTGHIDENLGSMAFSLSTDDVEYLRREFPDQKVVSNSVPLI